jgi:Domain of unknown function (DUF4349)
MRLIPFPGRDETGPDDAWHAELQDALDGQRAGSAADSWRELRDDVRALTPPLTPAFERRLAEQIARWHTAEGTPRLQAAEVSAQATATTPTEPRAQATATTPAEPRPTDPGRARRVARRRVPLPPRRWDTLRVRRGVSIVATLCAVLVPLAILAPWRPTAGPVAEHAQQSTPTSVAQADRHISKPALTPGAKGSLSGPAASAGSAAAAGAAAAGGPAVPSGAAAAAGRVQQTEASISLAPTPGNVQETASRVARLTVSAGGFVQSSHVQAQRGGRSEADLTLRLPSAKLSALLVSFGELAPVSSESQALQDITGVYDGARQRLADAEAERQALLRALAAATTEGQIESLHERLSQARSAIAQARSGLRAVAQRASTSEVEVTVLGSPRSASGDPTLRRGLHDAGRVLTIALVVTLIAAAILLPLALLLAALAVGRRAWRRYQRERVLDAP